jgi:hypothetical protein
MKPRKNMTNSIDTFLKQSDEIQNEIHRLSDICEVESSKRPGKHQSFSNPEEDYIKSINTSLEKHGFKTIPLKSPSISSFSDILIDVLTEFSSLKESLQENQEKPIENPSSLNKQAKSRFRKSQENFPVFTDSYKISVLDEVMSIIESKNYDCIIPDILKIKKAINSLPAIENFLNQICVELFPDPSSKYNLDLAISKIRGIGKIQSEFDEMIEENLSLRKIVDYFSRLFQVKGQENILETIECVFYFVHEMKDFLEKTRKILNLGQKTPADQVIREIFNKLNNF